MTLTSSPPPNFPAAWACACGQDSYGFWQTLELFGVQQIMRWIPAGEFTMGSPAAEEGRFDNENLHHVTLSQGFWLADTACTQQLWAAVMGNNPSHFSDKQENPVETVSWLDCQQFFSRVNKHLDDGLQIRFSTEVEWEYACRAGSQTAFSWGNALTPEQANYAGKHTVAVTAFSPNSWSLYRIQMHGNVWEWCADCYVEHLTGNAVDLAGAAEGRGRVLRGGSCVAVAGSATGATCARLTAMLSSQITVTTALASGWPEVDPQAGKRRHAVCRATAKPALVMDRISRCLVLASFTGFWFPSITWEAMPRSSSFA